MNNCKDTVDEGVHVSRLRREAAELRFFFFNVAAGPESFLFGVSILPLLVDSSGQVTGKSERAQPHSRSTGSSGPEWMATVRLSCRLNRIT